MEERAGERRRVFVGLPLSSVLSPLLRRGERKKHARWKIFAVRAGLDALHCQERGQACPQELLENVTELADKAVRAPANHAIHRR